MKKSSLAILALAFTGSAMAASTLSASEGVATIIDGSGKVLQTVTVGMDIPEGSTLSTTGKLTVKVDDGKCTANLSSGQTMQVSLEACKKFVALANTAPTSIASSAGFKPSYVVLGVGGLLALNEITKSSKSISPN